MREKELYVFRSHPHMLSEETKEMIADVKREAQTLWDTLEATGKVSREMSLAKTNLELAVMWATKAIALDNEVMVEYEE